MIPRYINFFCSDTPKMFELMTFAGIKICTKEESTEFSALCDQMFGSNTKTKRKFKTRQLKSTMNFTGPERHLRFDRIRH